MGNSITVGLVAGLLGLVSIAEANAFTRSGTVTGPNGGTASVSAHGGCAGGTCSRSVSRTGAYGGSVTRSGSASCDPVAGSCATTRTTTGPYGGSVVRNGTISR